MKKVCYFILKALFALKISKVLSWLFGLFGKTAWLERLTNNTHIAQYLTKEKQQDSETWSGNRL